MLKTALKPRWVAALVLALALSTVFVLLSQWQFSSAQDSSPAPPAATEQVRPLTEVFEPGEPMMATSADQLVSLTGHYLPDKQVLVRNRLHNDQPGYWVVTAFQVDGAPALSGAGGGADPVIPVARGWIAEPESVPAPDGQLEVTGRLLPTEGPVVEGREGPEVPSLSVAELINRWDVASYSGFVAAKETLSSGMPVGVGTGGSPLSEIQAGPPPQETPVNWLNIFYAVEWVVFAGFAFFLWWRLVADDYRRTLEEDDDGEDDGGPHDSRPHDSRPDDAGAADGGTAPGEAENMSISEATR